MTRTGFIQQRRDIEPLNLLRVGIITMVKKSRDEVTTRMVNFYEVYQPACISHSMNDAVMHRLLRSMNSAIFYASPLASQGLSALLPK